MMAEGTMDDVVMFRVGDQNDAAMFHPNSYQDYHSSDDELSSDDEDSVKDSEDLTPDQVSKPLMHPRQRPRVRIKRKRKSWQYILWPIVYLFIFLASMAAFVCLIVYVVNTYTNKLLLAEFNHMMQSGGQRNLSLMGCSDVEVEDVWVVGIPKILTESAFRLLDINNDGVLDVIFGFATGADKLRADPLVCDIYFNKTKPCGGGMLALDGRSGVTLWQHWSGHEIFGLNCAADLNGDGVNDCIGGGRAGTFDAVSGKTGEMLWMFNDSTLNTVMNVYTGQFISDLDGDGVQDIVNIHGGDPLGEPGSNTRLAGKLLIMSGRTGKVISWGEVPDHRESYYSPVIYQRQDSINFVLFGTGGETHGGSLWVITLGDLIKGRIDKATPIFSDKFKGFMTPPVLLDLNQDGTEDIVFATFNSSVVALDGKSYEMMWNFSYPMGETYATPAAGFYNDDDIPDFLIRWQSGPGFPLYYHSITAVLDGATGKPLLPYLTDSVGAQTSPLTISSEGYGNDIFLFWTADCKGHEGQKEKFSFIKGTNVHEQSRSDFCRLRFKTSGYSRMLALGQSLARSTVTLYNSEDRTEVEHSSWVNTTALAQQFLQTHPQNLRDYHLWQEWVQQQQDKWRTNDAQRPSLDIRPEKSQPSYQGADYPILPDDNQQYGSENDMQAGIYRNHYPNDQDNFNDGLSHDRGLFDDMYDTDRGQDAYRQPELSAYQSQMRNKYGDDQQEGPSDSDLTRNNLLKDEISQIMAEIFTANNEASPQMQTRPRNNVQPYAQNWLNRRKNGDRNPLSLTPSGRRNQRNHKKFAVAERSSIPNQGPHNSSTSKPNTAVDNSERILSKEGDLDRREDVELKSGNNVTSGLHDETHDKGIGAVLVQKDDVGDEQSFEVQKQNILVKRPNAEPIQRSDRKEDKKHSSSPNMNEAVNSRLKKKNGQKRKKRKRRHVGPHDEGGLQRLISTGTLAPPLLDPSHPNYSHTMDIIFATYWFYPAKTTVLLPEDEECVKRKMDEEAIRFDPSSRYYGMDHDGYQHEILEECLEESGHVPEQGTYESQSTYNPYDLHMGQMTVYRLRLKCVCKDKAGESVKDRKCARFLPHNQQQWASYMGSKGTSHWAGRDVTKRCVDGTPQSHGFRCRR